MLHNFTQEELKMIEDKIPSLGIDKDTFYDYITCTYEVYMNKIRDNIKIAKAENEFDEDMLEDLKITKDDYNKDRADIIEYAHALIAEIRNDEASSNKDKFVFPYKEIFNGNYTKLDKSKLTFAQRVAFRVDTLPNDCFEIYYDSKTGSCIPVYYDLSTSNEAFYALSIMLKRLAKKKGWDLNHRAPLVLLERDLMGINLDEALTPELQVKAMLECERNPIYMLREAIRILDKAKNAPTKYEPTIGTWTILWLYAQRFNIYRGAPRQIGKTTDFVHLFGGEFAVGMKNAVMISVHFKSDDAGKNRKAMVDAANMMPAFLKVHNADLVEKKGVQSWVMKGDMQASLRSNVLFNKKFNNALYIASAGTTETTAERVGRGLSVRLGFVDENNFMKNISGVNTALQLAHGTAKMQAERANLRAGLYYSSTAGKLSTKHGRTMYDWIFNQMCQWTPILFTYNYADLNKYMQVTAKKHFFNVWYGYQASGFDEAWIEAWITKSESREDFMTDMLGVWHNVDSNSIYNAKSLARISSMLEKQPVDTFMYDKYYNFTYFPTKPNQSFEDLVSSYRWLSVGIDLAYGQGSDSSVMKAIDLETGRKVFMFKSNTNTLTQFNIIIIEFFHWLKKVAPNTKPILVIEQNGPGMSSIPDLRSDPYIESIMFNVLEFYDKDKKNPALKHTNKVLSDTQYVEYGINQKKYRQWLTSDLSFTLVDSYPFAFTYKEVFGELLTLVRKPTGKIEHKSGAHDDIFMSTLLAYAPLFEPKLRENLYRDFGFIVDFSKIPASPIMSTIVVHQNDDNDITTAEEGSFKYNIVRKSDGKEEWDELTGYIVSHGERVMLDEITIMEEIRARGIRDPNVDNMRIRSAVSMFEEFSDRVETKIKTIGLNVGAHKSAITGDTFVNNLKAGRNLSNYSGGIKSANYVKNNIMNNKAKLY